MFLISLNPIIAPWPPILKFYPLRRCKNGNAQRISPFCFIYAHRRSHMTHPREEHIKFSPSQCHSSFFKTTATPPNLPKALRHPSPNPSHRLQDIQTTQSDQSIFKNNGLMLLQGSNAIFNPTINPTIHQTSRARPLRKMRSRVVKRTQLGRHCGLQV